jgi:hypothetical protein
MRGNLPEARADMTGPETRKLEGDGLTLTLSSLARAERTCGAF